MTFVLAIDTCGASGYVGVFDMDTGVIVADESLPQRGTQESLLPAIARVLSAADCAAADLAALAVVAGPGSFTGVRIGMAATKGLAEALDRPMIALSRLAVLAAAAPEAAESKVYAWLDAGRGDLYTSQRTLGDGSEAGLNDVICSREEASGPLRAGDMVAVLEPALEQAAPCTVFVTPEKYRQSLARMTRTAFQEKRFADTALLDAEYLRVPDAELAMRARLAGAGQTA